MKKKQIRKYENKIKYPTIPLLKIELLAPKGKLFEPCQINV